MDRTEFSNKELRRRRPKVHNLLFDSKFRYGRVGVGYDSLFWYFKFREAGIIPWGRH